MKASDILMMGAKKRSVNGFLYNWFAASDANFAPTDWKVPTNTEFATLLTYLTDNGFNYDDTTTGNKSAKSIGATTTYTFDSTVGAVGNTDYPAKRNITGFTALATGYRINNGTFTNVNQRAIFWLNTESSSNAYYFSILYNFANIANSTLHKVDGMSIRLLYTGAGTPTTVTDIDGNVYDTVTIGSQIWTKQNWKATRLANGTSIPLVTDGTTWAGLTTLARCSFNNDLNNV